MVVAVDETSQAIDKEQLHNMVLQAKENIQVDEMTVIADKGYYSALQFKQCEKDNIIPIVSKPIHSKWTSEKGYGKDEFIYDEEKGGYFASQESFCHPVSKELTEVRNVKIIYYLLILRLARNAFNSTIVPPTNTERFKTSFLRNVPAK